MINQLNSLGDGIICPVVIIEKNGKILTGLRHYVLAQADILSVWTLPGGRSEIGETLEQTLKREVLEEVNIQDFNIIDFVGEVAGSHQKDIVYIFYATTNQEAMLMEPEKFSEWRWVPISEYLATESYGNLNQLVYKAVSKYLLQ